LSPITVAKKLRFLKLRMGLCDLPSELLAATLQFADHVMLLRLEGVSRHVRGGIVQSGASSRLHLCV
jgi:hypothetical protein